MPKAVQKKLERDRTEMVRRRVAKCRALKKERENYSKSSFLAFKSASALGKAAARAQHALYNALTSTPRRKKAVIRKLYRSEVGVSPAKSGTSSPRTTEHKGALPATHINTVKQFYERDDVSRQAPGRKYAVTLRADDETKTRHQTRHLASSCSIHMAFSRRYFLILRSEKVNLLSLDHSMFSLATSCRTLFACADTMIIS